STEQSRRATILARIAREVWRPILDTVFELAAADGAVVVRLTRLRLRSFHRIAEGLGVFANSVVTRHNYRELGRLAERFDGREVHRIERADRLHRKRASDACKDVVRDRNDIAATLKPDRKS